MALRTRPLWLGALALLSVVACSDGDDDQTTNEGCGNGVLESNETCDEGATPSAGCVQCQVQDGWLCRGGRDCAPVCGDGEVVTGEGCDEVSAGCVQCEVQAGWTCATSPCRPLCGDGRILGDEECDDMDTGDGDGCNATCRVEDDFTCAGEPSVCAPSCLAKTECVGRECGDVDDGCGGTLDCGACTGWFDVRNFGDPMSRRSPLMFEGGGVVVVFGGYVPEGWANNGGTYDPVADRWTTFGLEEIPQDHIQYSTVFTGTELIGWGGRLRNGQTNTGWRYDLGEGTWATTSTIGAPTPRGGHVAVWTGTEMFVFGGTSDGQRSTDGALYDPIADTWRPVPTSTTAETEYALWTGTEVVLGGDGAMAMFRPSDAQWRLGSGPPRRDRDARSAVWTDDEVFLLMSSGTESYALAYQVATNTWREPSTAGIVSARGNATLVWTGREVIAWGGRIPAQNAVLYGDGARYDPAEDVWRPMTSANAPSARYWHEAVWIGDAMFVWGGSGPEFLGDGALYVPE